MGLPRIGRYFPFVEGQRPNPISVAERQEESNQVYGFLILSLTSQFFSIARHSEGAKSKFIRTLGMLCCACFLGNFLFLCSVTMSCYRYPTDFLAPLALAASLGILVISNGPKFRRLLSVAVCLVVAWNGIGAISVLFSIAENSNLFAERRPDSFSAIGSIFNRPIYWREIRDNEGPKGLKLTVRFPSDRLGKTEPLIVLGETGAQDFIYVYYAGPNLIRIGFMSMGLQDLQSSLIAANPESDHVVELYAGSFLPPDDDPLIRSVPKADLKLARQAIYLKFDNKVILDGVASFHRPRANVQIGQSTDDDAFGPKFTGVIKSVQFPPIVCLFDSPRWRIDAYSYPSFDFSLPPMPVGVYDPIVSFGSPAAGAELLVENLAASQARLVWVSSDRSRFQSTPFDIISGQILHVRIDAGVLLPPLNSTLWPVHSNSGERIVLKAKLNIFLQGKLAIQGRCGSFDVPPDMVNAGIDSMMSMPGVLPKFPGYLKRIAGTPINHE